MCDFEEESQQISPGSSFSTPGAGGMSWHRDRAATVAAAEESSPPEVEDVGREEDVETSGPPRAAPAMEHGQSLLREEPWETPPATMPVRRRTPVPLWGEEPRTEGPRATILTTRQSEGKKDRSSSAGSARPPLQRSPSPPRRSWSFVAEPECKQREEAEGKEIDALRLQLASLRDGLQEERRLRGLAELLATSAVARADVAAAAAMARQKEDCPRLGAPARSEGLAPEGLPASTAVRRPLAPAAVPPESAPEVVQGKLTEVEQSAVKAFGERVLPRPAGPGLGRGGKGGRPPSNGAGTWGKRLPLSREVEVPSPPDVSPQEVQEAGRLNTARTLFHSLEEKPAMEVEAEALAPRRAAPRSEKKARVGKQEEVAPAAPAATDVGTSEPRTFFGRYLPTSPVRKGRFLAARADFLKRHSRLTSTPKRSAKVGSVTKAQMQYWNFISSRASSSGIEDPDDAMAAAAQA